VRYHKNDPNFHVACCINACSYECRNWSTYRVHVHRKHKSVLESSIVRNVDTEVIVSHGDGDGDGLAASESVSTVGRDPMYFSAVFTLSLMTKHNLSHSAVDSVVASADALLESHLEQYKQRIQTKLSEVNVSPNILDDIPLQTSMCELSTNARRLSYYKQNFPTYLEPEEVLLGHKFVTRCGKIKKIPRFGYIVPFQKSIKNLLSMSEIWMYVQNGHQAPDEYIYDVCDGSFARDNQLFGTDKKALHIILNCDDMEIVNPLGSHVKKHKVTMFYYTLANIPPQFRSRTDVIQLLAVARTSDLRTDNADSKLLANFCHTLKVMSSGGIDVELHGDMHKIKGDLIIVCADTLAANWLGRFKEGVSFALRNCRHCNVENSHICRKFTERELSLRNLHEHRTRCADLEQLTTAAHVYWSRIWGITGSSCLLQLENFDLVTGLVQDPMHVLLEGVLPNELSQLLYNFIFVKKLFTLKWLNSALLSFEYSYLHCKAKPEALDRHQLDGTGHIKQTAAAMLTVVQTLPFIIGHKVPKGDSCWTNILRLIQIILFATSSYCSVDTPTYLRILIAEYLHNYRELYPKGRFIPKMHYLLHLPTQMVLYGPLRHHWCMRFEAKNGYFASKKYKNFKNVPLSLAKRHQLYMAYVQSSSSEDGRSDSYLYVGDTVTSGEQVMFSDVYPDLVEPFKACCGDDCDLVFVTKSVTIHGLEYREGCALVLDYVDDEPVFAVVETVIVVGHVKYFVLKKVVTTYKVHILSYAIYGYGSKTFASFSELKFKWPMSVYQFGRKLAIMNINSHSYPFPF